MKSVVDQLVLATALRDLSRLDQALVELLFDTLQTAQVTVATTVPDGRDRRWLRQAQQMPGMALLPSEAQHCELQDLPKFSERPIWAACVEQNGAIEVREDDCFVYCFPLFADSDTRAVAELRSMLSLTPEQIRVAKNMLKFYANFRSLLQENERDALTGLLNRKTFDEAVVLAAQGPVTAPAQGSDRRGIGQHTDNWLAVVDIDHFKKVNDTYGHLVGDEVLLLLAGLMRRSFRFTDRVFRFGGEEFVLLMLGATAQSALRALELFREQVQGYPFPQVQCLTVSIGYTRLDANDTPNDAVERADKALYLAKASGRNQVLSFEALVADGRLTEVAPVGSVDFF